MLLALLTFSFSYARSEKVTEIIAPLAKVIPTADGFIAEGEWDDAAVVTVGNSKFGGYLLVKHNWTYLWVYLDCPTDTLRTELAWDNGWVAVDPDMSGGSEPQEYDMLFHSHGHLAYIGDGAELINGSQWGTLRGHYPEDTNEKYWELRDVIIANFSGSGPSWGPTKASETLHSYWEFQIPLSLLELIPELETTTTFGFCASMEDWEKHQIVDWPVKKSTGNFWPGPDTPEGSYAPPSSWGKLTLSATELPEPQPDPWPDLPNPPMEIPYLYIIIAAVGVVVVVSAVVLTRRRRK